MATNSVTSSSEHSVKARKDDNSGSDWPSASAAAGVRLIPGRFSSSRVVCLVVATNLVTSLSEHSGEAPMSSVRKDDNSGSDWPSASAAAGVRLIPGRYSSSRVLCLVVVNNLVTALSEHSVEAPMCSVRRVDNSVSNWASALAAADVRAILLSFSSSIVLFLITSIKLNTTSAELSVKPSISSVGIFRMETGNGNHKVHPSEKHNSSVCKDDCWRNNWASASAADVRLIPCRYSWVRFLCLIKATNFVTALSEHSVKERMLSACKDDNSGSNWTSSTATADVRLIPWRYSWSRFLCFTEATNFVTASSEHSVKEPKLSVRKADNSGSNWPSASAAADVRLILRSSSFSRVLCLIAATDFVAASSEHSFKELMLSLLKADNSGNNWPRASANVDVSLITLSSTSSTGLCLKTSKSLVIAFAAFSVKPVIVSVPNDEL